MTVVNKPTAELKPYDKNTNCVGYSWYQYGFGSKE